MADEPIDGKSAEDRVSRERLQQVLNLVRKKLNASMGGVAGEHFKVYAPDKFRENPSSLAADNIFESLKETVWWLRWYDGQFDQLGFLEFLIFVHECHVGFEAATQAAKASQKHSSSHRASKHAGGWTPKKDRSKPRRKGMQSPDVNVKVRARFAPDDSTIRKLFATISIEPAAVPKDALN